jgi:hypothetical protein
VCHKTGDGGDGVVDGDGGGVLVVSMMSLW